MSRLACELLLGMLSKLAALLRDDSFPGELAKGTALEAEAEAVILMGNLFFNHLDLLLSITM